MTTYNYLETLVLAAQIVIQWNLFKRGKIIELLIVGVVCFILITYLGSIDPATVKS